MMKMSCYAMSRHRQRGATLVIGMIMLVLITLFVVAAVNMSTINLRVMGNTQARNESIVAAQQAIEQVASTNFPANPQPQTVNVDVNGDSTSDYAVAVAKPACLNSVPLKLIELDAADPGDWPCFGSAVAPNPGLAGGTGGGNSFCSNTQWDVSATTTDASGGSNATVTVHQGIGQRVAIGTAC